MISVGSFSKRFFHHAPRLFFICLLGILAVLFFVGLLYNQGQKSKATGETITLSFNPSSASLATGASLATVIKAVPSVVLSNMRGFDFKVNFDKTKVQLTHIEYLGQASVSQGYGDDDTKITDVNSRGYVNLRGEYTSSGGQIYPVTGANIVRLTISSLSTNTSTVAIDEAGKFSRFDNTTYILQDIPIESDGNLNINGAAATNTPTPTVTPGGPTNTPTPTVTPGGPTLTPTPAGEPTPGGNVTLNLKLKFQGILKKPTDAFNSLNVKIRAVKEDGTDYEAEAPFTADANGVWSATVPIPAPAGENYKIFIKGPKHIQKRVCSSAPTESFPGSYHCENGEIELAGGDNSLDFSGIYQLVGDLPEQDGVVNSYDVSLVRNNIGKTDTETLVLADLNLDGIVDTQDYSLVIAALSIRSDEGE